MNGLDRDLAGLSDVDRRILRRMTEHLSIKDRYALFLADQQRLVTAMAAGKPSIGPMVPGHRMARKWTFTSKRWEPNSFLFRIEDEVILSSVQATREGRGYLRELIAGIEQAGLRVAVPVPLANMTDILIHYGFVPVHDVWRRP